MSTADIEPAPARDKTVATLRARLALANGYVLHELADESFIVCRWDLALHCETLADVYAFARRIGAPA